MQPLYKSGPKSENFASMTDMKIKGLTWLKKTTLQYLLAKAIENIQ